MKTFSGEIQVFLRLIQDNSTAYEEGCLLFTRLEEQLKEAYEAIKESQVGCLNYFVGRKQEDDKYVVYHDTMGQSEAEVWQNIAHQYMPYGKANYSQMVNTVIPKAKERGWHVLPCTLRTLEGES